MSETVIYGCYRCPLVWAGAESRICRHPDTASRSDTSTLGVLYPQWCPLLKEAHTIRLKPKADPLTNILGDALHHLTFGGES